jgi:hypothetical protein
MKMPTFQRTEIVDARQFTGGMQQGTDIAFWVNSNNGRAHWMDKTDVGKRILSERIRLYHESLVHFDTAWVGDWLVRHQDGSWEVVRPEQMQEEYKEV